MSAYSRKISKPLFEVFDSESVERFYEGGFNDLSGLMIACKGNKKSVCRLVNISLSTLKLHLKNNTTNRIIKTDGRLTVLIDLSRWG